MEQNLPVNKTYLWYPIATTYLIILFSIFNIKKIFDRK